MEKLVSWSGLPKEEIERIVDCCKSLSRFSLASNSALKFLKNYSENEEPLPYELACMVCWRFGNWFLEMANLNNLSQECSNPGRVFFIYCLEAFEDKKEQFEARWDEEEFAKMIRNYIEFFVNEMDNTLSYGFDWDVVSAMHGFALTKERYEALKAIEY